MSETIQRYEPATGQDSTMRRVTFLSPHPRGKAVLYTHHVASLAERDRLLINAQRLLSTVGFTEPIDLEEWKEIDDFVDALEVK